MYRAFASQTPNEYGHEHKTAAAAAATTASDAFCCNCYSLELNLLLLHFVRFASVSRFTVSIT